MSGFFAKVKNATKFIGAASQKTKLKAEIAYIDNTMKGRKQQFGVEMYDLMEQKKTFGGKTETEPKVVEVYEGAEKDMAMIIEKKDAKQGEIDALGATNKDLPAETMGEKASKAGKQAKDAAVKTKIQAEMALLDREIKARKQLFGIQLYDAIMQMEAYEPTDTEVKAILDAAKQDIGEQQAKKDVKQEEINVLDAEQAAAGEAVSSSATAPPAEANATTTTNSDV
ncbi:expressed unknown protein [Seminavis robusta]|uniref:Uncharacterized protein n=1 Tax=Seminavis robusta TaxID=568900 RepID=A0A9N8HT70_9STRA|nr:expressed unknown protein [Seminavis robusta]|eukprot:Sro1475_g275800.1 n/a (226) ;mRNA; r:5415-6092